VMLDFGSGLVQCPPIQSLSINWQSGGNPMFV
jgi:hypothetical protein